MALQQHISLLPYNTFGIDVKARWFSAFRSLDELQELRQELPQADPLILGGGSNVLFTHDVDGVVLKNEMPGIERIGEDEEHVYIRAGAGVNWHGFVSYCIEQNLSGVENLSLIPGCVGASPMQNIGAYGVEIRDVFHQLQAWHLHDRTLVDFSVDDCAFGYRESVFKRRYKGQFVILNVTYKLNKQPHFNTSYGAIEQELANMGITDLSIKAISEAVIRIRSSKLPDPKRIGNAGSFFKNPEVSAEQFHALQKEHPGIVGHPLPDGKVKLAAGWLIEQCGWKGHRQGDAGVHDMQALVLVNHGHATGSEIQALSQRIIQTVMERFQVSLETEVNII